MATKKKSMIVDDEFTTLKNDIDKLQKSPTLYISFRGPAGSEQLAHEMVNNMVDEHRNEHTLSDGNMEVFADGETGMTYFTDTGRGIPFSELENACTVLQSGTKMDRASGGASGGEYGVGLTATNALSERFEITSTRDGQSRFLRFENGRKIEDRITSADPNIHGLRVGFKPSTAFLGEDAYVPLDSFAEWLRRTVYTLEPTIKITFKATDTDGKTVVNKVFQNTEGNVGGFIPEIIGSDIGYIMKKPIVLSNKMELKETNIPVKTELPDGTVSIEMIEMDRELSVEFAFNYSPNVTDSAVYGFTNMIEQIDGGVHVNALKTALSAILLSAAEDSLRKNDKMKFEPSDALTGLTAVVNFNTTMSTGFESQTKHKLGNRKFIEPLKKLYTESLTAYFESAEGKKNLTRIIDFMKVNARIRTDAANTRKKVKTSLPSLMDSKLIGNYVAANLIGTPKDELAVKLELYLVEGDSAGGQARKARYNPDIQGILNFTGKPDNFWNAHIMSKTSTLSPTNVYAILLDRVLGCGYAGHFNEENLIYDKIIFGFDADVDGDHMSGLTLSSIYAAAANLVLHGHCYRVITPLYKVAESQAAANKMSKTDIDERNYLWSKAELYDRFETNCVKYSRIKFKESDNFVSNDNMRRFLLANRRYYEELDKMSGFETVPKEIIEFIAATPDFEKRICELDPELHFDDGTIYGCFRKKFVSVSLTKSMLETINFLREVINVSNDGIYQFEFYDRASENSEFKHVDHMTIGQIMETCQKYSPYIVGRYKGWGEMSKYEMWKFAMNPNYRRLARYTVADVDRFNLTLNNLFVKNKRGTRIRKQMVQEANFTLDDIDN